MRSAASSDPEGGPPHPGDPLLDLARSEFSADFVAQLLVEAGAVDADAVRKCLAEYLRLVDHGAAFPFATMLIESGVISSETYGAALARAGGPAVLPAPAFPAPSAGEGPLPAPGRTFGRYRVISELGRGGAGVVLKAYDPSTQRPVALKFPRVDARGDGPMERFRREAVALGQLNHPNIVAVHEAGVLDGVSYIAMEFVDGPPLTDYLRQERSDLRSRITLLERVARAVQEAHARGIIHRDLKPGNILVDRARPDGPRVVVMDFGLAKLSHAPAGHTTHQSGIGTPAYMAPEQIVPGGKVDVRTDVYAMGVILYELLTGHRPFLGETESELFRAILETSAPGPRTFDSAIPSELETICLKCIEKEPDPRYSSAEAVADELKRWLEGDPILARRSSIVARARRLVRRHPLRWALGAVVLAAVAVTSLLARELEESRKRRQMEGALAEARLQMAAWRKERYLPVHDMTPARARLEQTLAVLDDALRLFPGEAAAWSARGKILCYIDRYAEAVTALEKATELEADLGNNFYWLGVACAQRSQEESAGGRRKISPWLARSTEAYRAATRSARWESDRPWEEELARAVAGDRQWETLDRIADRYPEGGEYALFVKGTLAFHDGDVPTAIKAFDQACDRARSFFDGYVNAVIVRVRQPASPIPGPERLALLREALDRADMAIRIDPGSGRAKLLRGWTRVSLCEDTYTAALLTTSPAENPERLLRAAIDEDFVPAGEGSPSLRGLALFHQAKAELALASLNALQSKDPRDHYRAAVDLADRALEADPNLDEGLIVRGRARLGWGFQLMGRQGDPSAQFDAAERDFTAAIEKDPDPDEAKFHLGRLRLHRAQYLVSTKGDAEAALAAAIEDLEATATRRPDNLQARLLVATARLTRARFRRERGGDDAGDYREALRHFEEVLKIAPGADRMPGLKSDLAEIRARLGMPGDY